MIPSRMMRAEQTTTRAFDFQVDVGGVNIPRGSETYYGPFHVRCSMSHVLHVYGSLCRGGSRIFMGGGGGGEIMCARNYI